AETGASALTRSLAAEIRAPGRRPGGSQILASAHGRDAAERAVERGRGRIGDLRRTGWHFPGREWPGNPGPGDGRGIRSGGLARVTRASSGARRRPARRNDRDHRARTQHRNAPAGDWSDLVDGSGGCAALVLLAEPRDDGSPASWVP